MSEAKNKRTQTETVELASGFAKVTTIVEYTQHAAAQPILDRVDNFMTYLGEYPNAQLDLFKNELTTRTAGDSRTDPDLSAKKKAPAKKKSSGKRGMINTSPGTSTKKSGRDRAEV